MDPDPDPGGPKTCGSGSAILPLRIRNYSFHFWRKFRTNRPPCPGDGGEAHGGDGPRVRAADAQRQAQVGGAPRTVYAQAQEVQVGV
jgi:hypothetical protein